MSAIPLADAADRDLIRHGLDETVIVEAAAGTGKTTELVRRILNVLASGRARIEQIVAVTFTEKAAGELKLRIRKELESLRQRSADAAVVASITEAIQHLEEAHVSTIHGFCAELLRERPVEAGIDPLFEVLTEPRAARIYDDAFRAWLHDRLEQPPEGVRRALRRSVWSRDGRDHDDGPIDRIRRAGRELAEWRDFDGVWRRDPFDRDDHLYRVLTLLHDAARLTAEPVSLRDPLYLDTAPIRELSHDIATAARFDADDPDGWEARLIDLAQNRDVRRARHGRGRDFGSAVPRDAVWTAYETLMRELDGFQFAADCDLAALLHGELADVVAGYEQLKQRAGALDFVDLLLRARDLLAQHAGVRRAFQSRFTRIFVDEFQDTDPLQAEILLLLAAGDPAEGDWRRITPAPGKLFIVGDPKQAIYRFRRADVETYQEVCDLLERRGARRAFLHASFRATPGIQQVVNAAFAPLMTGDRATLKAHYVGLSPHRAAATSQPAVVALPVPEPYGQRRVAAYAIEKSQPDAVGAFVHWLVRESGWTVTERTVRDELPMAVPVEPRHVCILFRRFVQFGHDVTRPYVEALEARGIPHLLVGGKSFHDREEVETIRAALAAIEWPDDELSVFATLRGALFAIDDATLLDYRHQHKGFHPFRIADDAPPELRPVTDALRLLRRLHGGRNYRPVADTITQLLNATRAHVGFVLRQAGEQSLANVLHVAELARQYEANGGMSFRGFVEELRDQADGGQGAEAPILEEGSEGVRLMTVHKAKGLEFPVVVLADMTAKLRAERADRLIDRRRNACYLRLGRWTPIELATNEALEIARDEAEGVRVAYVAATRARDLLVVPAVGDVEWDGGWTSPLNGAIYPPPAARRTAAPPAGCPAFKTDSVWRRPDNDPSTPQTVCPGQHAVPGPDGPHSVVWWDPHALDLEVAPSIGIRREILIMKDVPAGIVADGLREYEQWRDGREAAIAKGSVPSLSVQTATEWAASDGRLDRPVVEAGRRPVVPASQRGLFDEEPPAPVDAPTGLERDVLVVAARRRQRPGGLRFGELVHAMLAAAPLDADRAALEAIAGLHGRILAAPDDEVAAGVDTVQQVLAHELLGRARVAEARGLCRRETPVTCLLPDGMLVEGVVDLAFEDGGAWMVVDYKTDRELAAGGEEQYRRQVALYASAVAQATGVPCQGVLLVI
ncbi:MAG: UvrD-helicase domain-containing protein [Acidobacteriota bacterium]